MSKGQSLILDALMREPMGIQELLTNTGLSVSFIRGQLKFLEAHGSVEKVDQRIPHIYRIPPNNPMIKHRELIAAYEKELIDPEAKTDPVGIFIRKFPKADWSLLADNMEAAVVVIRNFESEGLLFETLEA